MSGLDYKCYKDKYGVINYCICHIHVSKCEYSNGNVLNDLLAKCFTNFMICRNICSLQGQTIEIPGKL